jgi:signal transduction histidine kinase
MEERMERSSDPTAAPGAGPTMHSRDGLCAHAVQFYRSEEFLQRAVARYLGDGLRARQQLLVLATPARWDGFVDALGMSGFDTDRILREQRVTFANAEEAMSGFMVDAAPDEVRFRETIGALVEQTRAGRKQPVRAYGEMVDILWRQGNRSAALAVEDLWNELAASHSFSLFCAYSLNGFERAADADEFRAVCDRHAQVYPADGFSLWERPESQHRAIGELQQRAAALEHELAQRVELEKALREALRTRRKAERELRAAAEEAERASRVKSDFLAVMSHELRTPLNAIIGYDELLAMEVSGPVNAAQREYLQHIRDAASQLLCLIDQTLDLARLESGREEVSREPIDGGRLLAEAVALVEPLAAQRGLDLAATLPAESVVLETDGAKLRQILLNLLSNALKFTTDGRVDAGVSVSGGTVRFTIADTGPGIGEADVERVFERFVQADADATRRHGGAGLGLAVSRDLARLLGGDILLESTPGRGSVFTVELPVVTSASTAGGSEAPAPRRRASHGGRRVNDGGPGGV